MIPSVGRIVHYTLSDADVASIPDAASEINLPTAGDVYPLLIVRTFGDTEASAVSGRVFLDGQHNLAVSSRSQGDGAGKWFQPPVVVKATTEPESSSDVAEPEQGSEQTRGVIETDDLTPAGEPLPDAPPADSAQLVSDFPQVDIPQVIVDDLVSGELGVVALTAEDVPPAA